LSHGAECALERRNRLRGCKVGEARAEIGEEATGFEQLFESAPVACGGKFVDPLGAEPATFGRAGETQQELVLRIVVEELGSEHNH
jgi:hypothetical protein